MEFEKLKSSGIVPSSSYDLRRELWLLVYASNSCKLVRHLCDILKSGVCSEGDSTYTGIINAIYVVYARPFQRCRGVGRLLKEDIPPESITLHDEIIHLRDKLYAHKDLNGYQVGSENFNTVKAVVIKGSVTLVSNELVPRGPKLQTIEQHADKLVEHFDTKLKLLIQKIRRPGWPPDGEYILNMDAISDDIFIPVLESETTLFVKSLAEQLCGEDGNQ